jgi:hypothetical protein
VGEEHDGVDGGLEVPPADPVATRAAAAALEEAPADAPVDEDVADAPATRRVLAASILCERSRRVSSWTR